LLIELFSAVIGDVMYMIVLQ